VGTKLFVGNLPFSVREPKLEELFSQHGTVTSTKVIVDRFSGRSKGFGFVEMGSDEEAERATEALNGTEVEGRALVVSEARPQQPRPPHSGGGPPRSGRW